MSLLNLKDKRGDFQPSFQGSYNSLLHETTNPKPLHGSRIQNTGSSKDNCIINISYLIEFLTILGCTSIFVK